MLEGIERVFYLGFARKAPIFYFLNNTIGVDKKGRGVRGYLVSLADCFVRVEQRRKGQSLPVDKTLNKCLALASADGKYFQVVA